MLVEGTSLSELISLGQEAEGSGTGQSNDHQSSLGRCDGLLPLVPADTTLVDQLRSVRTAAGSGMHGFQDESQWGATSIAQTQSVEAARQNVYKSDELCSSDVLDVMLSATLAILLVSRSCRQAKPRMLLTSS